MNDHAMREALVQALNLRLLFNGAWVANPPESEISQAQLAEAEAIETAIKAALVGRG
jgi:hypothetical protein